VSNFLNAADWLRVGLEVAVFLLMTSHTTTQIVTLRKYGPRTVREQNDVPEIDHSVDFYYRFLLLLPWI